MRCYALVALLISGLLLGNALAQGVGCDASGAGCLRGQTNVLPPTSADTSPRYLSVTTDGALRVTPSSATASIAAVSATSLVLHVGAARLFSATVTPGTSAGYLLAFDAAAVPASGTVTPRGCWQVPAAGNFAASWDSHPDSYLTGIVLAFSSTGCATFTPATALFLAGQAAP